MGSDPLADLLSGKNTTAAKIVAAFALAARRDDVRIHVVAPVSEADPHVPIDALLPFVERLLFQETKLVLHAVLDDRAPIAATQRALQRIERAMEGKSEIGSISGTSWVTPRAADGAVIGLKDATTEGFGAKDAAGDPEPQMFNQAAWDQAHAAYKAMFLDATAFDGRSKDRTKAVDAALLAIAQASRKNEPLARLVPTRVAEYSGLRGQFTAVFGAKGEPPREANSTGALGPTWTWRGEERAIFLFGGRSDVDLLLALATRRCGDSELSRVTQHGKAIVLFDAAQALTARPADARLAIPSLLSEDEGDRDQAGEPTK